MLDLPTTTLRAWEDRYEVIIPRRSEGAQRLYSRSQVEQLRFLKDQIEAGASAADAHRLRAQELGAGRLPSSPVPNRDARPLVLIAERDAYAASLAEYFLRPEGCEVAIALDATQAELYFDELGPGVVLIDLLISCGHRFRLLGPCVEHGSATLHAGSAVDRA